MNTDDSVKESVVGPVKGEDVDATLKTDDKYIETIGITCTLFLFIYLFFCVSLVTKRDMSTNIGFHVMKVDIDRYGELIPQEKSGYEHHEKVYTNLFIITDNINFVRYIIHMEMSLQQQTLSLGLPKLKY